MPVEWRIDGSKARGCARVITIPKLRMTEYLTGGVDVIEFTPDKVGNLEFMCTMAMTTRGAMFKVVENPNVGETKPIVERDVYVEAKAWSFSVNNGVSNSINEIRVKKGEKVNLYAKSLDMGHGISIPDYDINIKFSPDQEAQVSFIADKAGEFNFKCSVYCGQGHMNHMGKLIVEE